MAVVCGTWGAVGARGLDGRSSWHSGFWIERSGAVWLGTEGLHAVCRTALEIAPPTSLTRGFLDHYGESDVETLLHRVTRHGWAQGSLDLARAAGLVLDEAERGDATAVALAERHASILADYAVAGARRGPGHGDVPTRPGGWRVRASVRAHGGPADRAGAATGSGARPVRPWLPPAAGALLLALREVGRAVGPAVLERLRDTLPAPAEFAAPQDHLASSPNR